MQKLSKRTLASRANGKLSRGPVTPAGLLRASANSTRHGMLSENLVLDDESKDLFALLHQQFIDRLNPTDGMEICLVEDLASTVWRQRRLVAIETHLFKEAAAKRPEPTYLGRIGGAFSDLCQTPEMHLLDRYESRLHRMFQRSLKNLELLRQIEHTDPSTGELTELPVEVTGIPDAPADPAPPELPNEPSCEQPPVESASYLITSKADPESDKTEDLNIKGGADFSLLPTGPEVLLQHSPEVSPQEAPTVPPAPPTSQIHEIPNEPSGEQPPVESASYPITSKADPEADKTEDLNIKGGADFSLLPTGPEVLLQHSPEVSPQEAPTVPPAPPTSQIHEIPNEPRSPEPPAESTVQPITSVAKPEPIDPYAGYPCFEIDLRTGGLKRIA